MAKYYIVGYHQGNQEIIDEFENKNEAEKMLEEYKMAFGSDWIITIRIKS